MSKRRKYMDCICAREAETQEKAEVEELPPTPIPDLPYHLILEIIGWLPPKAIVRFRSVCKLWYSTLDSKFIEQRSHLGNNLHKIGRIVIPTGIRGGTRHLQYHSFPENHDVDAGKITMESGYSLYTDWYILGTCNGLICYASQDSIFLCNPSIDRVIPLPICSFLNNTPYFLFIGGIGFDPVENDYTVVLTRGNHTGDPNREDVIFSLKSNSWRRYEGALQCMGGGIKSFFLRGFIHWHVFDTYLVVFDVSKKVYGQMNLPYLGKRVVISVLKGLVCAVVKGTNSWEVWTMNEYGVYNSWAMCYRVVNGIPGCFPVYCSPFGTSGGYLIQNYTDNESEESGFVKYDFKTSKYSNLCRTSEEVHLAVFVEATLELIDHPVI